MSVVLTKFRVVNVLRCIASYALSLFGSVRIFHRPLFVSVEPSAVCQLRCPECPVGRHNNGMTKSRDYEKMMSHAVWEQVLVETAQWACTMQFYFQGEPLLNKDLPRMVAEAHEAGLYTIVSTNAQALTPETAEALVRAGLSRIIVSMDGLTPGAYNAYRVGGDLERCKAALRYLREANKRLHGRTTIELQCLRLRTNEHEWGSFRHEYKRLGADRLVFKTAQLYDYTDGHPLMPTREKYSRYVKGADGHYRRKPLRRGCMRVWSGVVVTADGDVLPCCYDKMRAHAYGNILNARMKDLFSGEKAAAFRKAALHEQPEICKECWK